ncbi:hypothetical protein EHB58_09620 [Salmonella enterica subsp. enterica serovar Hull]|uniref:Uncharacterized protein n=1 Tax=Salmonella enterica subsp. enterica serovar Hull TaxID=1403564 RepID=A0A5X4PE65_SALET|nr:hypothetical protein [Salmonella enterica]EBZ7585883.1 hypothetical protein [Salmonella enterica subsp. enterica serovar Hull]ECC3814888.1 hypothetical protein [Salmonella enterica subsp. enterica]ECC8734515.1 hypothetical protein [Salmonella bongori]ECF2938639.1 hypothetical protein [Salmonella enterica subsp. enterica serovar Reading]ECN6005618.1 hypothetical protein [Salmonella enterica subsp. enterica serovar Brandenburg]
MMFIHEINPSETGENIFIFASELAGIAAKMAKDRGITPKDARLALELASRVSVTKKETPAVLVQKLADAISHIRTLQSYDPVFEEKLAELIVAADALADEL